MSVSKAAQVNLPMLLKNRRLGGIIETGLTKKGKVDNRKAFEPGTRPGADP